jgi:hypothetical protein
VEVPTTGLGGTRETTNFRLGRSFGVASLSPTGTHFSSNPHNGQCCSTSESLKTPVQAPRSRDASFAIMMLEWFRPGMEEWSRGQSSAELRSPNARGFQGFQALRSVSVGPHPAPSPQARTPGRHPAADKRAGTVHSEPGAPGNRQGERRGGVSGRTRVKARVDCVGGHGWVEGLG